ncbi:FK506-binding protein 15-like isoform X2 [Myxocyprinus asiaticus]|uniref:FK506-binding protein 15-like isoform X2 n=1 Tax=Myxocyprinus asiaticus TaxID=70543 RepID=UPI00222272E7|nr:FK506-binding protein 15-like isoform X2 [Myxocyprinus asiaticus]
MENIKDIIPDYHDGDCLCPKSGAKLASLFGLDQAESQGNESFQFTAPKQPKKTCTILGPPAQKTAPPPCAPAVLFATPVHAFIFLNGQYVKQGKMGAAVLGNHVTKEYKILLYGSKQKQITTARIHRGFVLTVQPFNYVTFYDDQQQNWSLMFDSEKSRSEFCKEVCIARWNSEFLPDSLVTQDLVHGEGQAIDVGDTVEVAFSGWLFQNHSLRQIFDSNLGKEKLQRVKLGAGKALKGWEEGMLGMQKGGRRLLIVPPSMGYGSKGIPNSVPPTSTLVFDVEIHRVKFSKYRHSGELVYSFSTSPGPSPDTLTEERTTHLVTTDTNKSGDQAPKGKVESISECLKNPGAIKAKLVSRIAKMGQPMLPFLTGAISAQSDHRDSETEDAIESGWIYDSSLSHSPSPKPLQMSCSPPSCRMSCQKQEEVDADIPLQTETNTTHSFKLYPFTSIYPSQHVPYQTPDITAFLMSDTRQQNTEILLAIEKVARRVDQLTCKVDELQKEGCFSFGLSSVTLETNVILHNIQRIIHESMCLKKDVLEKSSQLEEKNNKIGELIDQRYREQSSQLFYQRSEALQSSSKHNQTLLLQTEQDKAHLVGELPSSITQVCELQQEVVNLQQRVTALQTELSAALNDNYKHCAQISLLEAHVEELLKKEEQSEQQWKAEKQKCKEMELIIKNMHEEIQDLKAQKENLDQILSDRKRKWQVERERLLLELEEQYRSSQQEILRLLMQLRKARDTTEPNIKQLQEELESEWQEKCDVFLAEQRGTFEGTIAQLQEQVEKFEDLKTASPNEKQQFETHLCVEVKRVLNGVFRSLRTEFHMQQSYTGRKVLVVLLNTIKSVTMQLLSEPWELESDMDEDMLEEEYLFTEERVSTGGNAEGKK